MTDKERLISEVVDFIDNRQPQNLYMIFIKGRLYTTINGQVVWNQYKFAERAIFELLTFHNTGYCSIPSSMLPNLVKELIREGTVKIVNILEGVNK